ncbi:MAG: hypothetical protein KAW12_18300 [Candidatus Aminicenantes bacterium]|nr:hypothetical protein [Candidatus Aminicenantes bacterium]
MPAAVMLSPPIEIDPGRVIVFTNVYYKNDELLGFGIPAKNIIMKSSRVEALSEIMKETEYMHSKL